MEENKKELVVNVYSRCSTKKESQKSSIDTQNKYFTEYVKYHSGWRMGKLYVDTYTGTKLDRPEFTKLMYACGVKITKGDGGKFHIDPIEGKKPECDLILCKSTSRFARSDYTSAIFEALREKGVGVFFQDLNACTLNPKDSQLIGIMSTTDSCYSKSLSYNARWSYIQAIENRKTIYGTDDLFGFTRIKKDGKTYLEPESQAHIDIINEMFQLYLKGWGFRKIHQYVVSKGFMSKKTNKHGEIVPISLSGVKDLMENEKYMGYLQKPIRDLQNNSIGRIARNNRNDKYNYELVKADNITPIVSEELFMAVQKKRLSKPTTQTSRGIKQKSSKYAGLLQCSDCGSGFQKSYDSKKRPLYICGNRKENGTKSGCNMPYITEEFLDEQLEVWAKDFSEVHKSKLDEFLKQCESVKYVLLHNFFKTDNSVKITALRSEIKKLEERIHYFTFEADLTEDLNTILKQLSTAKKEKEQELYSLESATDDLQKKLAVVKSTYDELSKMIIPDHYTGEEVYRELACINAYHKEQGHISTIEELEKFRQEQGKRNNVDLEYITKMEIDMQEFIHLLQEEVQAYTSDKITEEEEKALDSKYTVLVA